MKKIAITILVILGISPWAFGQQEPQYTQYMLNTMVINPAYAGARGVFSIGALHRSQWLGLEGAPRTQTLFLSTPVARKVGLGFSVVNDNIGDGTVQETYFDASVSYTLPLNRDNYLALGLSAGGDFLSVDFTNLVNYGVEPNLPNIDRKFSPQAGIGAYFYNENLFISLSVPNLLETEHFDNSSEDTSFIASERRTYYLMSGYIFDLSRNTKFRPGVLFKAVSGAPLQVDLNASFIFDEKFIVGASYRLGSAVSGLFGFQITDKFLLGLAYDVETTELGSTQFNDGSFEVFLRYDFLNRFTREVTNKFF